LAAATVLAAVCLPEAAVAAVALSLCVALTVPVHLGLDLRGGTQIVLETRPTAAADADGEATDRTVEVLRGGIDALGVAETSRHPR
jgi:SecD/SecF fusion protein